MGTVPEGLVGSVVAVLVIWAVYAIATRRLPWGFPTPTNGTGAPQGTTVSNGTGDWWKLGAKECLVIGVGICAFAWSMYGTPGIRPSGMGNLGKEYWLQILIVWITLGVLIALSDAPKVFQKVLAGVMLMLLVVLPIWSAVSGPAKASVQEKQLEVYFAQGPQSSWPEPSWPTFVLEKKGEKRHFSFPQGTLPALDGEEIRVHCTYRSGLTVSFNAGERACSMNDELSFVVVENLAEGPNAVRYAVYYAPKT